MGEAPPVTTTRETAPACFSEPSASAPSGMRHKSTSLVGCVPRIMYASLHFHNIPTGITGHRRAARNHFQPMVSLLCLSHLQRPVGRHLQRSAVRQLPGLEPFESLPVTKGVVLHPEMVSPGLQSRKRSPTVCLGQYFSRHQILHATGRLADRTFLPANEGTVCMIQHDGGIYAPHLIRRVDDAPQGKEKATVPDAGRKILEHHPLVKRGRIAFGHWPYARHHGGAVDVSVRVMACTFALRLQDIDVEVAVESSIPSPVDVQQPVPVHAVANERVPVFISEPAPSRISDRATCRQFFTNQPHPSIFGIQLTVTKLGRRGIAEVTEKRTQDVMMISLARRQPITRAQRATGIGHQDCHSLAFAFRKVGRDAGSRPVGSIGITVLYMCPIIHMRGQVRTVHHPAPAFGPTVVIHDLRHGHRHAARRRAVVAVIRTKPVVRVTLPPFRREQRAYGLVRSSRPSCLGHGYPALARDIHISGISRKKSFKLGWKLLSGHWGIQRIAYHRRQGIVTRNHHKSRTGPRCANVIRRTARPGTSQGHRRTAYIHGCPVFRPEITEETFRHLPCLFRRHRVCHRLQSHEAQEQYR